ncbi:hypothetical protein [Flavobacterium phycosphaerae]|uniref:hypothetical protein n=1 Tax=Flavobacterium phycosphaerae TaxID=2697515 RepID=UPI00138AB6C8|nr:hypothetical protein [Flavobacterium phycosphaerae]
MKTLFVLVLILLSFFSHGQTKIIYEKNSILKKNAKLEKAGAYASDKSIVVFTNGYWGDTVSILIEKKVISKGVITIPEIGFATLQVVPNDSDVKISFGDGSNLEIILSKMDLKKFKYAYVSKENTNENKRIQVIYSNETKYSF